MVQYFSTSSLNVISMSFKRESETMGTDKTNERSVVVSILLHLVQRNSIVIPNEYVFRKSSLFFSVSEFKATDNNGSFFVANLPTLDLSSYNLLNMNS